MLHKLIRILSTVGLRWLSRAGRHERRTDDRPEPPRDLGVLRLQPEWRKWHHRLSSQRVTRSESALRRDRSTSGLENKTSWLALARRYAGLMVEGRHAMARRLNSIQALLDDGVRIVEMLVDQQNAKELVDLAAYRDPDLHSVDIDGNDYYVTKALLDAGLRPKVLALEYNCASGPERRLTIAYRPKFVWTPRSTTGRLYYGESRSRPGGRGCRPLATGS